MRNYPAAAPAYYIIEARFFLASSPPSLPEETEPDI
jgi:hypothetical protein